MAIEPRGFYYGVHIHDKD